MNPFVIIFVLIALGLLAVYSFLQILILDKIESAMYQIITELKYMEKKREEEKHEPRN